jgi:hypothetical protein
LGEAETFLNILQDVISNQHYKKLIFICDGAKWIWNW